jgi:Fe2+ transport system protein B
MAGDVRGHDLDSWWQNRAAYRDDVNVAVDQWRVSAEQFASAAGGAPAAASAVPPNETLQSLRQLGQSVLAALKNAVAQLNGLEAEHQRAHSDFAAEQTAIESECHQRVQAERERARGKAHDASMRYEKSKVVVRKFIATLIFLVVLYVLVRF